MFLHIRLLICSSLCHRVCTLAVNVLGILIGTLTMELGGVVTISCEKTGYHAELEFKLKVCVFLCHLFEIFISYAYSVSHKSDVVCYESGHS